jgi:hypothetical protein
MKRREFLASAGFAPALLAMPPAADALPVTQGPGEAGFESLFDGVSLDGWSVADGRESAFYVDDGAIVVHQSESFPAWLRSARQYENFDFRGEFFVQGWTDSGIYLHAPEHGRSIWCGMKINIFHQVDATPAPESMGSIFPLVPPRTVNVRSKGEWNTFRILMDWPRLQVWTNDEMIHDLDVETVPDLRHRLRSGYLGLESLSYPIRFRGLRVRELPSKVSWTPLYETAEDFAKWRVLSGTPIFQALGNILHGDGDGHFGTTETFRDFELQMYVRHVRHHNGGVVFGGPGGEGRAGATRCSCTTWRAPTTRPDRSTASSAARTRASNPSSGGCSSSASRTERCSCAPTATRCLSTTGWRCRPPGPSRCRPMVPAAGPSTSTSSCGASEAARSCGSRPAWC